MRIVANPRRETAPLEALRVSMRDWLVSLLVWLIDTLAPHARAANRPSWFTQALAELRRETEQELRDATHALRLFLIIHADRRLPAALTRTYGRTRRPGSTPSHARRARDKASTTRRFIGGALKGFHTGSLQERAARLRDAFDNPEPFIQAVLAQMTRMYRTIRACGLVLISACDALHSVAQAPTSRSADTS
jgi:hypothetical protein